MSKQLPPRPDLDQLKKQAKELLKAHQTASPSAVKAIKEYFPRLSDSSEAEVLRAEFTLQNAQHVVAREYGFAGWTELSAAIDPLVEEAPQLSDREIQILVSQLDKKDLAFFLWTSDFEVQEKVLSKTTEYGNFSISWGKQAHSGLARLYAGVSRTCLRWKYAEKRAPGRGLRRLCLLTNQLG